MNNATRPSGEAPRMSDTSITTYAALEKILSESPRSAKQRRQAVFDELCGGPSVPIVLYGAGGLGRRVARGLRDIGREPVAFADRRAESTSTAIDGLAVLAPSDAARRYGQDAVFIVAIWNAQTDHRYPTTRTDLLALGVRHVAPALALFWKHPEVFLPYFCLDIPETVLLARDRVLDLASELADDASRDVLLRQTQWRTHLDFDALPIPVSGLPYLQDDLLPPRANEFFVDCGAYDGDTLRTFRPRLESPEARYLAVEPDPASFAKLTADVDRSPSTRKQVKALQIAVGARRELLRFEASGLASAHAAQTGGIEVQCLPLDDILAEERPTLIKMDLEGAEIDALRGGESTIRRCRPSMAICVYHRPDHLWRIPLLLRDMLPDHHLYLRPHGFEGWDLVCYAVAPQKS